VTRGGVLLEGAGAGLLAWAVVAVVYALLDMAAGQPPLETAFLLGEAMGAGAPGPGEDVGIVLAANGVHLGVCLITGVAAAWMVAAVEHRHTLWYVVFMVFIAGVMLSVVAAGILGVEVAAALSWAQVGVGNVLGAVAIAGFLGLRHRDLLAGLSSEAEESAGA
jgi:hypothetical protein